MKISLYTISYLGIWYDGPAVPLRKLIPKAAEMGFDGIAIDCKGQHGLLGDLASKKARDEVRQLAESEGVELAALETVSNFMTPILETREANAVWVQQQMHAARDLEVDVVKLFTGWMGTSRRSGHGWYDMLYQ
ncbi:MAG: sugar phosphate isomerase/epimerase family protein, partial [Candidatus Bathyarchaeia archaeon]